MKCAICGHEGRVKSLTTVTLERGPLTVVVKEVPSTACPNCDEAYVDEAITRRLLGILDEVEHAGGEMNVCRYRAA